MRKWEMKPGFKVGSVAPNEKSIAITCCNFTAFNDVDSWPIQSAEALFYNGGQKLISLVGVWKPKGSPSLL